MRKRLKCDDGSSTTSTSTKASRARRVCRDCGLDGGEVLPLTKCTTCHRRYHAYCSAPTPHAAAEMEQPFVCGKCLRVGKHWPRSPANDPGHAASNLSTSNFIEDPDPAMQLRESLVSSIRRDIEGVPVRSGREERNATTALPQHETEQPDLGHGLDSTDSMASTGVYDLSPSSGSAYRLVSSAGIRLSDLDAVGRDKESPSASVAKVEASLTLAAGSLSGNSPTGKADDNAVLNAYSGTEAAEPIPQAPQSNWVEQESETSAPQSTEQGAASPVIIGPSQDLQCVFNENGAAVPPAAAVPHLLLAGPSPSTPSRALHEPSSLPNYECLRTVVRYKEAITCRQWLRGTCRKPGPDCLFAHSYTQYLQPYDRKSNKAHAFTCWVWQHKGKCNDGDRCSFSHTDTGLYVEQGGSVSMKHLTCAHWKTHRICLKGDNCKWAHTDTGLYVDHNNAPQQSFVWVKQRLASLENFAAQRPQSASVDQNRPAGFLYSGTTARMTGTAVRDPDDCFDAIGVKLGVQEAEGTDREEIHRGCGAMEKQDQATTRTPTVNRRSSATPANLIHGVDTPFSPPATASSPTHTHSRGPSVGMISSDSPASVRVSIAVAETPTSAPNHSFARSPRDPRRAMARMTPRKISRDATKPLQVVEVTPWHQTRRESGRSSASVKSMSKCGTSGCKAIVWNNNFCTNCQHLRALTQARALQDASAGTTDVARRPSDTQDRTTAGQAPTSGGQDVTTQGSKTSSGLYGKRRAVDDMGPTVSKRPKPAPVVLMKGRLPATTNKVMEAKKTSISTPDEEALVDHAMSQSLVRTVTGCEENPAPELTDNGPSGTSPSLDDESTMTSITTAPTSADQNDDTGVDSHPTGHSRKQETITAILSNKQPLDAGTTCQKCRTQHKKCLHDGTGALDPQLCKAYLSLLRLGRADSSRTINEMKAIRIAASGLMVPLEKAEVESDPEDDLPLILRRRKGHSDAAGDVGPADIEDASDSDEPLARRRAKKSASHNIRHGIPISSKPDAMPAQAPGTKAARSMASASVKQDGVHGDASAPTYTFLSPSKMPSFKPAMPREKPKAREVRETLRKATDLNAVVRRLQAKGVVFEEDSSDEEMHDSDVDTTFKVQFPWQSQTKSSDLYNVAPMLRPNTDETASHTAAQAVARGGSRKDVWRNLFNHQIQDRKKLFGDAHPHRIVRRSTPHRLVTTITLQDHTTQSWRHPFDPPEPEQIQVSFDQYMGLPEDTMFEEEDDELMIKDGNREKACMRSGMTRRSRAMAFGQRWHFMK